MNHDKALEAHLKWIARLRDDLLKGVAVDPHDIARDDLCELGRWLHGAGRRYCNVEGYDTLAALHHAFHKSAAHSAELAQAGRLEEALVHLDGGGAAQAVSTELLEGCRSFFDGIPSSTPPQEKPPRPARRKAAKRSTA
jgi:hypothetical protein